MSTALEEAGRLGPDQHGTLVLAEKSRPSVVFRRGQPLVALLSVERLKFLARFGRHRLSGKMPKLVVTEQLKAFDSVGQFRSKLIRHGRRRCHRIQQFLLKTAMAPLRTLSESLVESLWQMECYRMNSHDLSPASY